MPIDIDQLTTEDAGRQVAIEATNLAGAVKKLPGVLRGWTAPHYVAVSFGHSPERVRIWPAKHVSFADED